MPTEREDPTGEIDNIDVDALMEQVENGGGPTAPADPDPEPAQEPTPEPQPQAATEFEFDHNGKLIKVPYSDPRLKQWAREGYSWRERAEELRQQREEFERSFAPYKTIDAYAKENPDWWNHVVSSYEQKLQGAQDAGAPNAEIAQLKEQLSGLLKFREDFENRQADELRKEQDKELDTEIQSIREQFKDLDWESVDANGMNLERRALDHALKHGIQSFRAAFRDLVHDDLLKRAEERGKETLNKDLQKRNKLGLLGSSPTPKKGVGSVEGVKSKSYEEILAEAKEELGIA